ncbi:MAG: hypothetical protein NC923_04505 [Candidatus Omnitrophica bacterium]|nr:hypothetical protein [Candidatus Omnitrophota bacterium]
MKERRAKKSQASLEMAVAVFLGLMLLAAILRVFIWVNARMVMLQQDYEKNRGLAGSAGPGSTAVPINEDAFPALDIMGNGTLYANQSN